MHGSILQVQDNRLTRRQAERPPGRQTAGGLRADHGAAGGGAVGKLASLSQAKGGRVGSSEQGGPAPPQPG